MKNIIFLMASLCLGLWIGCYPHNLSDAKISEMSTAEKWASLKEGMSKDKVFKIIGKPQSSRISKTYMVYTFDCFLCTATFDTSRQLKAWHGPKE